MRSPVTEQYISRAAAFNTDWKHAVDKLKDEPALRYSSPAAEYTIATIVGRTGRHNPRCIDRSSGHAAIEREMSVKKSEKKSTMSVKAVRYVCQIKLVSSDVRKCIATVHSCITL